MVSPTIVIRVRRGDAKRLQARGQMGDSYAEVIARLLDEADAHQTTGATG